VDEEEESLFWDKDTRCNLKKLHWLTKVSDEFLPIALQHIIIN